MISIFGRIYLKLNTQYVHFFYIFHYINIHTIRWHFKTLGYTSNFTHNFPLTCLSQIHLDFFYHVLFVPTSGNNFFLCFVSLSLWKKFKRFNGITDNNIHSRCHQPIGSMSRPTLLFFFFYIFPFAFSLIVVVVVVDFYNNNRKYNQNNNDDAIYYDVNVCVCLRVR